MFIFQYTMAVFKFLKKENEDYTTFANIVNRERKKIYIERINTRYV